MKHLILLLCLITGITSTSIAQLGKMQFEDAEEQFAAGKYKLALELLNEAEASLGKTNPMIEHLRIIAMTEIAKQNPAANFETVKKARTAATDFLQKYNGNEQLEEKYRDVYKASKALRDLPTNDEEIVQTQKLKENEGYEQLRSYTVIEGYKDGATASELRASIAGYQSSHKDDTLLALFFNNYNDIVKISNRTGKSFGHHKMLKTDNNTDNQCSSCRRIFEREVEKMTQLLGFAPAKSIKPEITDYTWTKGTKTVGVMLTCQKYDRKMLGGVLIWSEDIAFK